MTGLERMRRGAISCGMTQHTLFHEIGWAVTTLVTLPALVTLAALVPLAAVAGDPGLRGQSWANLPTATASHRRRVTVDVEGSANSPITHCPWFFPRSDDRCFRCFRAGLRVWDNLG